MPSAARDISIVTPSCGADALQMFRIEAEWPNGQKRSLLVQDVKIWQRMNKAAKITSSKQVTVESAAPTTKSMDAARPQWLPEGRHQEDLNDFHDRLIGSGYRFKSTTPLNANAARHYYVHKTKPDAVINEYWKGGSTLTSMTSKAKDGGVENEGIDAVVGRARDFGVGPIPKLAGGETYKGCAITRLPSGRYYVKTPNLQIETGLTSEEAAKRWIDENYKRGGDVTGEGKRTTAPASSYRPKYNAEAVQKEINKDKRIGGKEAKAIHAILKGRGRDSWRFGVQLENQTTGKWLLESVIASSAAEAYKIAEKAHPGFLAQGVAAGTTKPVKDEVMPVGEARDIQGFEVREKLGISEADWNRLSKEERQMKAREAVGRAKDGSKFDLPDGDFDYERAREEIKRLNAKGKSVEQISKAIGIKNLSYIREVVRNVNSARDSEVLPVGIVSVKPSSPVPMPTEDDGKQRYAAADAVEPHRYERDTNSKAANCLKCAQPFKSEAHQKYLEQQGWKRADDGKYGKTIAELEGKLKQLESMSSFPVSERASLHKEIQKEIEEMKKGRATDAQISGSDPKDHFARAQQYEIAGDRARALDSYRAAASGYRRAAAFAKTTDEARINQTGETKAREGVAACQTAFDAHYDHPSCGRVKVCDSAEAALRTAIERTRAGERVAVSGTTVKPRARAGERVAV